ncbi:hypothetical protein [Lentibacillus cibarius]|uniref:DUF4367 domain-containing protein n=1 Tax=Lentibacillus cibarius TaxID=2583219 RepID=A0A5S3QN19_9BACI|nr:hypothetical protein [Lentibacillus cibarius]TMN23205.1 hypothetical protein FFL34_14740 [Lentibacillus cibarius]
MFQKYTIFVIFVLLLIISACSSQSDDEKVSFQDQVNEALGTKVFIPKMNDYPITLAEIRHSPTDDKNSLIVRYSKEKGELRDESYKKKYEDNTNADVLYGIYGGEPLIFRMTYHNGKANSQPSDSKTINGIHVQYHKVERNNAKVLLVSFNAGDGSYLLEFNLQDELTQEKSFEIVESMAEEVSK